MQVCSWLRLPGHGVCWFSAGQGRGGRSGPPDVQGTETCGTGYRRRRQRQLGGLLKTGRSPERRAERWAGHGNQRRTRCRQDSLSVALLYSLSQRQGLRPGWASQWPLEVGCNPQAGTAVLEAAQQEKAEAQTRI